MPLVAKNSIGQRLDITKVENPKQELKRDDIFCPLCNLPFFIAHGPKRKYFRHQAKECQSEYERKGESIAHLTAKEYLRNLLQGKKIYKDAQILLEYPIPEIMRVADIIIICENGEKVVHEIQLSPITQEDIEQRTKDYFSQGIDVYWWLGEKNLRSQAEKWCIDFFGEVYYIDVDESSEYKSIPTEN